MLNISNCPISGLQRKVEYDFYWFRSALQIIIECNVHYFKDGEKISTERIKSYKHVLRASTNRVDPKTGALTDGDDSISEYEYYANVIGSKPVVVPDLIEGIIQLRDSEGKFNV